MESYSIKNLTFAYPNTANIALDEVNLNIIHGQFVTLCGKSGCGKSTLLRHLKSVLAPHGHKSGQILFEGQALDSLNSHVQSSKIGFIMQSPDNQIVTDKVWHELAFGLESLGVATAEIRARVAEMASFFGIQTWFHKSVTELSGGQKQLLNLASIMVMNPAVLILDEPTSQLDPIASQDFLETLGKINRELGTTILITEHRLEEVFPMSDRVIVMDLGRVIADGTPQAVGERLKEINHHMFTALPTPMRVYSAVPCSLPCPTTVREGRQWLEQIARGSQLVGENIPQTIEQSQNKIALEIKDAWFRYEKSAPDVVKGLSVKVYEGEIFAIVGGNGTGKTTTLSIMSGLLTPYRGKLLINGDNFHDIQNKYDGLLGVLPQNPQALFLKKTVELDLYAMLDGKKYSKELKAQMIQEVMELCELDTLLERHPYDLSGGEQQRAALGKILLLKPQILLLDEPTKGLDAHFKEKFAGILQDLKDSGVTIIMVSHDIEFCARYATRCAMFFDGNIVSIEAPREFFAGKSFYTTSANRMARSLLPKAILDSDVILACGGVVSTEKRQGARLAKASQKKPIADSKGLKPPPKIMWGIFFLVLMALTTAVFHGKFADTRQYLVQFAIILQLFMSMMCFFPQRQLDQVSHGIQTPRELRKLSKRTLLAMGIILFVIPLTIYIGIFYLGDRKYYFISLLIILETLLPFCIMFEQRKPQARELIIISVLCAIAVSGRAAFFMVPQFKPVIAIVILAGVCFGGETGFLVGAVSGFVSNFFFGQGPWTPWQMFAFGIIGFLAGLLFKKGFLRKTKGSLCIFGGLSTFFIYGGIMNPASVIMWQANPTGAMLLSSYLMGIPFDIIHSVATVFFLWFISGEMIEKLDRIKVKYGILER